MSVASQPVKLAIVGSGAIAQTHAEAIGRISGAKLTAVCSRDPEKARLLADRFGARSFTKIEDMLGEADVEGVLVSTASGVHQDAVIPALRAGRHVLCEKPLEISLERVRRMIGEAEASNRILAGFFPLRFGAGAAALREAVDAGRFGRLTFLSARVKWWRDADYYRLSTWRGRWDLDGGGALMNQGIHAVDLLQWFGGVPTEVSAFSGQLAHPGIEVEDTLAAIVRFEGGAVGTIEAATSCYPGLNLSLEVSGNRGTAVLENDRITDWRFEFELPGDDAIRSGEGGQVGGAVSDPKAISCEGHRHQIASFCEAIRGEPARIIDGRHAGRAVAIVEAIYRSAASGKVETVFKP